MTAILSPEADFMAEHVAAEQKIDDLPAIYDELRFHARRFLRHERPDHTLQPTALVNEAILRLMERNHLAVVDQHHLLCLASRAMREVLVDHARGRNALKRGGHLSRIPLTDAVGMCNPPSVDILALDDALNRLVTFDPQLATLIELRFFGGLTVEQTAQTLGVSSKTVQREWRIAKLWLSKELGDGAASYDA